MSNTKRKNRIGTVVSSSMNKTAVVSVEWRQRHPLYGKQVRRVTKAYAHDETNQCEPGDLVAITETRPLSKTKRWRIVEILHRQALPTQEAHQSFEGQLIQNDASETQDIEEEPLNDDTNEGQQKGDLAVAALTASQERPQ